ncbi:MAG: hypothetical protein ACRDY0_06405 [Acidimicrobiales bacterium]
MTRPACGWPLADGNTCPVRVERDGQRCREHRRDEAAAKAATARAAHLRIRPAPPELSPLADEDAAAIFSVLDRHQVAYVVIGGMAAAMWGSDLPRTTDADITPASDADNLGRLAAALKDLGARLRVEGEPQGVPAPLDADTLASRQVLTLLTDHGPLDVSFVPEGTTGYADLATRAVRLAVGNHPGVPVADLADVIASKEAAGRAKDLRQLPSLRRLLGRLRPPPT